MLSPRLRWKVNRIRERLAESVGKLFRREPRPRLCFSCGRLVGAAETVCSYCGASQAPLSLSAFKRVALALIPEESPVTYTLLFANLLFFAVGWVLSLRVQPGEEGLFNPLHPGVMLLLGAKQGARIFLLDEYWRLVMANFLHWDLWHIGFNSLALWQVGPPVEETFGSRRFLFLYLATGVCGFLLSAWWNPLGLSAGASASLFGLIGIQISYLSQRTGFAREHRSQLIRWAAIMLVLGLFLPFDNAGHLGGLLSGLVLGRLVSDRRPADRIARLTVELMAWGSAAVILWSLAMVLLHLPGLREF